MTEWLDLLACRGFQVLSSFFQSLPLETALWFGRFMGRVVFYFSGRRRVAYADMKAALGPVYTEKARWKIIREQYANSGMMLVEVLRFPKLDLPAAEKIFSIDHPERIREAYALEKGGIFHTMRVDRLNTGVGVHRALKTQRVVHLWYQAHIGQAELISHAIMPIACRPLLQLFFQSGKAGLYPVLVPGLFGRVFHLQLSFQIL